MLWSRLAEALCNLLKHPALIHLQQTVNTAIHDRKISSFHETILICSRSSPICMWDLSWFAVVPTTSDCATSDPRCSQILRVHIASCFDIISTIWRQSCSSQYATRPPICTSPNLPGFPPNASLNMLVLLSFLPLWAVLSSAQTHCRSSATVPSLASCDRALIKLEDFVQNMGDGQRTFGPSDSRDITLPIAFIDPVYGAGDGRCFINIFWDPRPGFPSPHLPPADFDHFRPFQLQRAAFRIRDTCLQIHTPGQVSKVGFEWIEPHQWVQVQIGIVFGNGGDSSNAAGIDGDLAIGTANGTNVTVSVSMVNEGNLVEIVEVLGTTLTDIAIDSRSAATEVVAA